METTGQIGLFKIINYASVGKNLRRIEAITRLAAIEWINQGEEILQKTANLLGIPRSKVFERIVKIKEESEQKSRQLIETEQVLADYQAEKLLGEVRRVKTATGEVALVVNKVKTWQVDTLGRIADQIESKVSPAVVVLASDFSEKLFVVIKVSESLRKKLSAGSLMKQLASLMKGGGGGSSTFAQGSGRKDTDITLIQAKVTQLVEST
ncbi:MAG: DHHA1 domain-containing protein [Candidatus Omnitrophica bacterium]|nr:DHHA1 domain-containing protein [Candidatus Omnitrophota bacterium]